MSRELMLVLLGQTASALGLVAAVRVLTSTLSPSEYGAFVLGLTGATLVSQTVLGPLAMAAQRFYSPAQEAGDLTEFWAGVRRLGLLGSAAVLTIGLAGGLALTLANAAWGVLALAALPFAVLGGWEGLLDALQNAARRRGTVAWHQGLRQWLRPILALVVVKATASGSVGALIGYAIASGLVLVSQVAWAHDLRPVIRSGGASGYTTRLTSFAAPFAGWGVFTWAQLASDRWALGLTAGPSAVAAYSVLLQLGAQPLYFLATAAAQLAEPIVYARAGSGGDIARVRDAVRLTLRLGAGGAAVIVGIVLVEAVAHPVIVEALTAPDYWSESRLLPLAAISGGLLSLGQFFALASLVLADSRVLLAPKIVTAVLGIAMNFAAAYLFGVQGVLLAGILASLVYCGWTLILTMSRVGVLYAR